MILLFSYYIGLFLNMFVSLSSIKVDYISGTVTGCISDTLASSAIALSDSRCDVDRADSGLCDLPVDGSIHET